MSVLFNNQYNEEQAAYQSRQHVRRVGEKDKRSREEELLVFGYACSLFSDDEKAAYFDEGRHLIPWMGDESLMIDRFDVRLLLEELSQLVSKPLSGESQLSDSDLEIERLCDEERYLALEENVSDADYEEEEEMKRFKAAIASADAYTAVGFSYDQPHPRYYYGAGQEHVQFPTEYYPYVQEQPTVDPASEEADDQSSVQDIEQEEEEEEVEVFVPPEELGVPEGMEVPDTAKLHAIIERTAFFIKDHGPQMEIVVKAKQSGNQQFDFLQFDHDLNPYYKLILSAVRSGTYEPVSSKPAPPPSPTPEEDDSEESDGEMELHPLLTASLKTPIVSKNKPTSLPTPEKPLPPGWTAVTSEASSSDVLHASESATDSSFHDVDGVCMSMPYHGGYHTQPPSQGSLVPPPPGESPPGIDHSLEAFDQGSLHFHQGIPGVMYPEDHLVSGMSLTGVDMAGYALNAGPPIIPPPPDLKPICDKLAEYVARNGQQFEDNIREKNDPRFDFLNETSDHYTYYHMRRKEFEQNPVKSSAGASAGGTSKNGQRAASNKPVRFQIKTKDTKKPVMEYQNSILFKTAKADESDEEEGDGDSSKEGQAEKGKVSQNGPAAVSQPDVQGPKTEADVMAEERTTKLKQEKEKELQRLEEEAKSTTSSLRRQVQLERRRRAQLFINMLKKTKPAAPEQSGSNQNSTDVDNIFEPTAPK